MIKAVTDLADKLGVEFTDNDLLEEALTHRSAGMRNGERLEFLGDAILGFVIADEIFSKCPAASEGEMSRIRATLVCKKTLAEIAQEWNFGDYLRLGSGELKSGGFRRASILSDAVEAVIGALYKDQGYSASRGLIETLFGDRLNSLATLSVTKDAKSRLQERLQAQGIALPTYQVILEHGPAHDRQFSVACSVEFLKLKSEGTGSSRRIAEQQAAEALLGLMEHE